MAEPSDLIIPLLREMRAESATRHAEVIAPLDAVERAQVSFKHALTSDTLLRRLLTGGFEQRIEALERQVRELQGA
jgi:hypothetical protein